MVTTVLVEDKGRKANFDSSFRCPEYGVPRPDLQSERKEIFSKGSQRATKAERGKATAGTHHGKVDDTEGVCVDET
jgi:hypothetical protein